MGETRSFASLSPRLLARKGGAKPAMRSQLQLITAMQDIAADQPDEDLGWNDMGDDTGSIRQISEIAPIFGGDLNGRDVPDVVIRQQELSRVFDEEAASRRSATTQGRRAAFTLRIDAERHLKLRLASTVTNRSAQQILTEALDKLLDQMPDIQSLAADVRSRS